MSLLRREFGIAEPVKRAMELQIVRQGEWRPSVLGGSANVHSDVLMGRDWEMDWEDVYTGSDGINGGVGYGNGGIYGAQREGLEFHSEMEGNFGMVW